MPPLIALLVMALDWSCQYFKYGNDLWRQVYYIQQVAQKKQKGPFILHPPLGFDGKGRGQQWHPWAYSSLIFLERCDQKMGIYQLMKGNLSRYDAILSWERSFTTPNSSFFASYPFLLYLNHILQAKQTAMLFFSSQIFRKWQAWYNLFIVASEVLSKRAIKDSSRQSRGLLLLILGGGDLGIKFKLSRISRTSSQIYTDMQVMECVSVWHMAYDSSKYFITRYMSSVTAYSLCIILTVLTPFLLIFTPPPPSPSNPSSLPKRIIRQPISIKLKKRMIQKMNRYQ